MEAALKRKKKLIILLTAVVAVIVLILSIFISGYFSATKKYKEIIDQLEKENERLSNPVVQYEVASREVNIDLIKSEIKEIGELATIEYLYTDAGKYEDSGELFGKKLSVGLTTKSFIAKWDGMIKAGIDLEQVVVDVSDVNKTITVYLPKAKILSHEIDEDSLETLDEKNGLFNPIKIDDIREFDAISKDSMEERAIENGLLDKAEENAKNVIQNLIYSDVVEEQGYEVVFEIIEE